MSTFWLRAKFIWEYATHLQTDNNPPLELIFKFVDTLDKKDTLSHMRRFGKTDTSKVVYSENRSARYTILEEDFPPDSFGDEFKRWLNQDGYIVDLFKISLVPGRRDRKDTRFSRYAEHTMLQHDLIHFFNGYDTSPIGEVAVLSFNLAREWRKSYATILYASLLMSIRNTFMPSKYPKGTPIIIMLKYSPIAVFCNMVIEGWRRGKRAPWFMDVDWNKYLNVDLQQVRKELQLEEPAPYWQKVQPIWKRVLRHYKKYARKYGTSTNSKQI